ncbi:hypothetical protein ACGFQG_29930 [Nocardia fluminea]|uniref:hypothetical protein n=1 Tax=Nocardia fluminea TaxID=134984 RepID=UPI0037248F8F
MNKQVSDPPGVRWFTRGADIGFARRRRRTAAKTAIGYVRIDLAGPSRPQCESLIRTAADDLGYELLGTLVLTATPLTRLRFLATELAVDAVLCPTFAHLEGQVPAELLTLADVVVIDPLITYCRWDPQLLD